MNSKFNFIFVVCFVINVFIVSNVNANPFDGLVVYNDSVISPLSFKDIFNMHHAFVIEYWKWENGLINFKIDKNFDDREIDKLLSAMYEIERSSCIRFAAHDPRNGPNYVMIVKDRISSSRVGCGNTGKQLLQLSVGMIDDHQTILHELLHTVGFGHHHQRSDRDFYIQIHLENTNLSESEFLSDYAQYIKFDSRVEHLTPFDFDSVMLYEEYSDSINNESVITSKIDGAYLPTNPDSSLSKYDKILLNRFYDCHIVDKVKSKIFYEDETQIVSPMVVNYHEIQRAKDYIENKEMHYFEENQPTTTIPQGFDEVDNGDKENPEDGHWIDEKKNIENGAKEAKLHNSEIEQTNKPLQAVTESKFETT